MAEFNFDLEQRVAALETLVQELRNRLTVTEAAIDRNSLENIKYVRYERPKTYVPPQQVLSGASAERYSPVGEPFFSDGLGPKQSLPALTSFSIYPLS
jgi:hypothetical protein